MDTFVQLVCFICLIGLLKCTMDLNFKELQFVAGELEVDECRKLAESLHKKELFTENKPKFTGGHEPNKTCLFLLLKYDRTEGKGKTFLNLAIRLRQIGRHDIAEKLSKKVYHEKALALKEKFLNDPYRKMIRKNSFLLDDEKPKKKIIQEKADYKFNWDAFWISVSVLSIVMLTCCGFKLICPQFGKSLWHRCASKGTIDMCNLCDDECTRCWRKFKVNYKKHVIGIEVTEEKDDEEQLMKEAGLV